ncbi:MAG: hypothetical protein F2713_03540 [Actinobacteria bacterium]|uniref:Unannotated protein n=1 Tax=freshwater metagenome TaxID=449393 RepID=A0A6J6UQG1_9ZZZZ|nr:hypothetical protein [Actinomycetota bacterium]
MTGESLKDVRMQWAALASIGAGVVHGTAVGLHADHPSLSRVFLILTVLQVGWGIVALQRNQWSTVTSGFAINGVAVIGWILTRTTGIAFVSGLEIAEKPQPADTLCALLAVGSVCVSLWAWRKRGTPTSPSLHLNGVYLCSAVTLLALWSVTGHAHSHGHDVALTDAGLTINADGVIVSPSIETPIGLETSTTSATTTTTAPVAVAKKKKAKASPVVTTRPRSAPVTTVLDTTTTTIHGHSLTTSQALAAASGWPRAWDGSTIDFAGIDGVTAEQSARATALIQNAKRDLPKYADTATAIADGYASIGDAGTGFEHFIKIPLLVDGRVLDTTAPESLVYSVKGGVKTLVSAMFIANPGTPLTDTTLVNYAGGLMQWHVHTNLCWMNGKVVGVTNAAGVCVIGTLQTGGAPMVHVWITPHVCGPFAALEGNGAGVADASDSERVDLCNRAH